MPKHGRLTLAIAIAIALLGVASGCAYRCPDIEVVDPPRVAFVCGPKAPLAGDAVAVAVDRTLALAYAAEPDTTALVEELAKNAGGEVVGLEHRLKTRSSALGKYHRLIAKEPGKDPDEIVLYDALRYTIVVPDEPPGHHDEHVRTMIRRLEERGDRAVKVKNYWPRGDSYSGVNTVLVMPSGLHWEVQFHTPDSWRTKNQTHHDYETMRAPDTPREEKRRLFEAMSELWDRIPIPLGILEKGSLHPVETILTIPAP